MQKTTRKSRVMVKYKTNYNIHRAFGQRDLETLKTHPNFEKRLPLKKAPKFRKDVLETLAMGKVLVTGARRGRVSHALSCVRTFFLT